MTKEPLLLKQLIPLGALLIKLVPVNRAAKQIIWTLPYAAHEWDEEVTQQGELFNHFIALRQKLLTLTDKRGSHYHVLVMHQAGNTRYTQLFPDFDVQLSRSRLKKALSALEKIWVKSIISSKTHAYLSDAIEQQPDWQWRAELSARLVKLHKDHA